MRARFGATSFAAACLSIAWLVVAPVAPTASARVLAQDAASQRLRAQRDTLASIRREREELERKSVELQSSVHDLSDEVSNLDHRAEVTARLVKALDTQLATITEEVDSASDRVTQTESELQHKRMALRR
ncbi:MAG TPA: hypothetical protein VHV78_11460, partial [Gemmatimonadaceae bacterium]|nr:hypothetical protein [Gemmatimonadaceae bacterium]